LYFTVTNFTSALQYPLGTKMRNSKYARFGIVFLVPLALIFSHCFDNDKPTSSDPRGANYAGSASCLKCHKSVYQDYIHMAHYQTSRQASSNTVHGSFSADSNTVPFNDSLKAVMEKHGKDLYQVSYINGKQIRKERFDLVFGSKRAETYLYWKNNKVYQMPITYYFSLHKWANSPAYSNDSVNFSRVIGARCFECHSSYIKNMPGQNDRPDSADLLDQKSLIPGIDCEHCHGPGAEHVNFHLQNPAEKKPMYITSISKLSRAQRIDLCSVCHSGNSKIMIKSTFDFKPGDTLANYTSGEPFHQYQAAQNIDVHGNQVKLLTNSRCYLNSKIECATCHQAHDNEIKTVAVYSQYCTGCHSTANHNFCKMATQLGAAINNRCIDCHMPMESSHSVLINGPGKQISLPFQARTHLIAIYPDESKKIMAMLKTVKAAKKIN
jgi:Cytochrome c554 and c-prime